VSSAECGKEVVHGNFVRQIFDLNRGGNATWAFVVKQIVRPQGQVQDMPGLDPRGIVVIVFLTGLRKREELCFSDVAGRLRSEWAG
jgi:hypothetical protein